MQNIVIPVSAAPPQSRAPDTGAGGGADGSGGLFGLLLSARVADEDTSNGIGRKSAENGLNPLAALLISALVQGSIFNQGNTVPEEKTQGSQRAAAAAAVSGGAGGNAVSALTEIFSGNRDAALAQLAQAYPQFAEELQQLLAPAEADGTEGGARETLAALLDSASQSGGTAGDAETAQALGEIRRLFAELLGKDASAEAAAASRPAEPGQPAAQGAGAKAQEVIAPAGPGAPAVRPVADGQNAQATDIPLKTAPEQPVVGSTAFPAEQARKGESNDAFADDGEAELAGKPESGSADRAKPAAAEPEHEPVDFGFALKAAQGRETSAAVSRGARAEVSTAGSAQQAFDGIVDRIALMKDSSRREMEISLKPDYLGKVVIKLSMDEGGLVAKIAASNPKVQDAFLVQAGTLQASLESQGLKDVRVVVTSSSVPDASLQQQAERRGQEQRERGRRPVVVDAAASPADAGPVSAYERVWRTGTIDYLA